MVRCDDAATGFASPAADAGGGDDGSGILAEIRNIIADARAALNSSEGTLTALAALAGIVGAIVSILDWTGDN